MHVGGVEARHMIHQAALTNARQPVLCDELGIALSAPLFTWPNVT
jgi:hypothetical protein